MADSIPPTEHSAFAVSLQLKCNERQQSCDTTARAHTYLNTPVHPVHACGHSKHIQVASIIHA